MRLSIICWLIFLVLYLNARSQVLTLIDHQTGEPVGSATLMSESPQLFATTNSIGQVDISTFRGLTHVEIRALGYKSVVKAYSELISVPLVLKMESTTLNLDYVVVSASRWKESTNSVPSKVALIDPKEVTLQNPQTAADLLSLSGKVFVQKSQQGGGSPMIRGFATNRLLYTVDGVRMNTAIFRGGNIQNVISLDPLAMENTEVLFGPGSVIYGSDAIGGVMSFQTLTPQFSMDDKPWILGEALTRFASSNQEKTAHSHLNVGWKKWAFLTSISANNYDDLKMGGNGPDDYLRPFNVHRIDSVDVVIQNDDPRIQRPSGYSQINFMQKVRYEVKENWEVQYGLHYSETSNYSRYDRQIRL